LFCRGTTPYAQVLRVARDVNVQPAQRCVRISGRLLRLLQGRRGRRGRRERERGRASVPVVQADA